MAKNKQNKHAGSSFDSFLKEEKIKLPKLTTYNEEDFIQALDYANVMLVSYTNTMESCAVLKIPAIKEAYDKAVDAMQELYQTIGRESDCT